MDKIKVTMLKTKKTYSIHFPEEKKVEKSYKYKRKKLFIKAFFNIGMGLIFASYNVHLIKEKIENDIPIINSIEEDYKKVKNIVSEPFLNILKKTEGSSKIFYADNKGYATGYGMNFTQNDESYNNEILNYAGVNSEIKKQIIKASSKYRNSTSKIIPSDLKNIKFTQEQIDKMAFFAKKSYEHDFLIVLNEKLDNKHYSNNKKNKLINSYKNLYENQKAVLIHMTYKVGQNNLKKYNTFFDLLISYLETLTIENKDKVAKKFIYHYKDNGEDKLDNRVSIIHYEEFMKIPVIQLNNEKTTINSNLY